MARKPSGSDTVRSETLTIRLPPATRWALELLARIERTSVASVVQTAVDIRIKSEIIRIAGDGALPPEARVLDEALFTKNALPHDRVFNLARTAPTLLTREEASTLRLLEDLKVLTTNEVLSDSGPSHYEFDYNPLVVRILWPELMGLLAKREPTLEDLKELKALQKEAETLSE